MNDDEFAAMDHQTHNSFEYLSSVGELGVNIARLTFADDGIPPKGENRQLWMLIALVHVFTPVVNVHDYYISQEPYDCPLSEATRSDTEAFHRPMNGGPLLRVSETGHPRHLGARGLKPIPGIVGCGMMMQFGEMKQ